MRTLKRDFYGWLASVALGAYVKCEDWDAYSTDTLEAFQAFVSKARRDVEADLNRSVTRPDRGER